MLKSVLFDNYFPDVFTEVQIWDWNPSKFRMQLGSGVELPCSFLKVKRSADFGKKVLIVSVWKISIQNVVLIISMRKNSKMFPGSVFFSCVFEEINNWSALY